MFGLVPPYTYLFPRNCFAYSTISSRLSSDSRAAVSSAVSSVAFSAVSSAASSFKAAFPSNSASSSSVRTEISPSASEASTVYVSLSTACPAASVSAASDTSVSDTFTTAASKTFTFLAAVSKIPVSTGTTMATLLLFSRLVSSAITVPGTEAIINVQTQQSPNFLKYRFKIKSPNIICFRFYGIYYKYIKSCYKQIIFPTRAFVNKNIKFHTFLIFIFRFYYIFHKKTPGICF